MYNDLIGTTKKEEPSPNIHTVKAELMFNEYQMGEENGTQQKTQLCDRAHYKFKYQIADSILVRADSDINTLAALIKVDFYP